MELTCFDIAYRFIGLKENPAPGKDHPLIQYCLSLCDGFNVDTPDEVAWCSAFAQLPAFIMNVPRSKSAAARSWLRVGRVIAPFSAAHIGNDVVVLKRGNGPQPGPDVLDAPGHVGFFAGQEGANVLLLAGNQGNAVSIAHFPMADVLGVRRLYGPA